VSKARTRTGNLSSTAASFVGRRQQRKEICDRLAGGRLASLISPAGVGKTRLALQVADRMNHLFQVGCNRLGASVIQGRIRACARCHHLETTYLYAQSAFDAFLVHRICARDTTISADPGRHERDHFLVAGYSRKVSGSGPLPG